MTWLLWEVPPHKLCFLYGVPQAVFPCPPPGVVSSSWGFITLGFPPTSVVLVLLFLLISLLYIALKLPPTNTGPAGQTGDARLLQIHIEAKMGEKHRTLQ